MRRFFRNLRNADRQALEPAARIESLEPRALVTGVTMALNGNGSLVIQGTPGNDAISIVTSTAGIVVESAALDVVKTKASLWTPAFYALRTADLSSVGGKATLWEWGPVKRVLVIGGGGSDAIAVDTATQAVTVDQDVDSRVILLKHNRSITDFASTALQGTYGGNNQVWQAAFDAEKKTAAANSKAGVVFLGDSMIERFPLTGGKTWQQRFGSALNLGLTGDLTSQVLYRVENGLLNGLHPKAIVLEVGTNNISLSNNAAATVAGIQSCITAIRSRLPDTRVLVCSIMPRSDPVADAGATAVNALLAHLDNGRSIRFLDTSDYFSSPRARAKYFRRNNIHMNAHGYEVWGELIAPVLDQMLH